VRNLGGVGLVVHEEKVQVAGVVDEESLVAGRHHVAGLAVVTISDLWHGSLALEASSDSVVDTLGLSPAGVHAHEPVTLVTAEARGVLLNDWHMLLCGDHLCCVDGGLVVVRGGGRIERLKVGERAKWPSQAREFWASASEWGPCTSLERTFLYITSPHHLSHQLRDV